jgi:ABC-type oligopeptide transport system substrate-binding subunit
MEWTMLLGWLEERRAHMIGMVWGADYPDPDNFLRVGFREQRTGWRNDTYDELVEEARRVTDHVQRMRLYQQAETILVKEAPVVPITYGRSHWLIKPWVKAPLSTLGGLIWKDVIIEPH